MTTEFERALPQVLTHEGGYSNHPDDPGGATMKGVTQRVYDDYRQSLGMAPRSVKLITPAEINAIYRRRYWNLIKGDQLPAGVGYVVFDGAVNSGCSQSVKWLQRALGRLYTGVVDGLIGEGTLNALRSCNDHDALIARVCALRMAFLKALKGWRSFGKGWTGRVAGVLRTGQAWATGAEAPASPFFEGGQAKAIVTDAKSTPPVAAGDLATGGGGIGAVVSQAIGQLMPLATSPTIANIVTALTIASVLMAAAGYGYRVWAKYKADRQKEALA